MLEALAHHEREDSHWLVSVLAFIKYPAIISSCVEPFSRGKVSCSDRPGRMFDKAALAAVAKLKYKSGVVDGEAIATSGVKNMITLNWTRCGTGRLYRK